jgi:hypothetical protein
MKYCVMQNSNAKSNAVECNALLQENVPEGYDRDMFGVWPQLGAWVIKMRYPPSWNSPRTNTNWHTITLVVSRGENVTNHLGLGPLLSRIVASYCTCKSGMGTNAACCHRVAAIIALMAPLCFNPAKVQSARLVDIYR